MRLKGAPCGYVAFDDERRITDVNDEALHYLGHAPGELIGQNLGVLLPPAVRMLFHANVYPALADGHRVEEVYALLRCKDGNDLPVLLGAVRREREGRYETHCVFLAVKRRDSFARHLERLEACQPASGAGGTPAQAGSPVALGNQEQTERLSTLGLLLASVVHEINNPLSYVQGNLDLFGIELGCAGVDPVSLSRLRECESGMRDGVERIRQLALSVSLVSRAPSDAVVPFHVGEAIDAAVRLVSPRVREVANLEVRGPRPGATVFGDPARLAQVVMNLVINAGQALSTGSQADNRICVSNATVGDAARIEVADNGPGIPEALHDRVFAPFYTTKPIGEGTGLGLTICRQIVSSLRGDLELRTSPGGGATFRISLPTEPGPSGALRGAP